ncbi:hypothetical protein GmHk_10G028032 [Glycine max]|nr:hypothetical protein GmHk_10G028032 [Glycine max]
MIFILCVLVSIYEGSTTFHNIPLLHGQVKVGVEEVKDAEAPVPVPTDECNRQKASTECGYYVMHLMSTIILGSFKNNCETYFNDVRPLKAERLKALRIQWAQYYLKVRNQT